MKQAIVSARILISLWLCLGAVLCGAAADPRPAVGPGASKDEVINAYGWPSGQSQSGTKEMLSYPQGVVLLENGRVEKVDFSMTTPWPAPKPRPGPSPALPAKITVEPVNFWLTNFDGASREATRRKARILALFTGPDWSPASKRFNDEVAFHPEFVNAFMGDFVFLQLDFPKSATQAADVREHNERLRARYGVTVYPTLLVLAADGAVLAQVDLNKPQAGDTYRARMMAAVRETRDSLIQKPAEAAAAAKPVTTAPAEPVPAAGGMEIKEAVRSVRAVVINSVLAGLAISGGLLWLIWSRRVRLPGRPVPEAEPDTRMGANGLPTRAQIATWTSEKVRAITAALAESEGYVVTLQPAGADKDLVLKQRGETQPRVVVCCSAGGMGPVAAKRVRELFGTLTMEGVPTGWFVSPTGFAAEARTYADQKGMVLIDGEQLLAQLRDLPPMLLPKVLARAA